MDLRHMIVVCGITDLQNPARNCLTHMFIDYQEFAGIDDFYMRGIKDLPYMINDHNLVPNQEALLGAIKYHKLQVLVWWENDCQSCGLAIIASAWTEAYLIIFITQINI